MADVPVLVAMTRAHIELLMPHEREMFGTEAWSARSYRRELADTRHRHYIAAEGIAVGGIAVGGAAAGRATAAAAAAEAVAAELLGWAGVRVIGETAEVLTIGVVPAARRRGIGRVLLAALYTEATRRGAFELLLEVRVDNDPAISLYENEGFVVLGRRRGYYNNGLVDALIMRRDLPAGADDG